ncbi:MAG: acyl carrier protein [Candidatus Thiodiazotropha sp. (ex Ctena orbiculata)]|nr:acyl carrier protein [Candidatus Thiodiazotropha taylori]MBT2997404.1 acyl carrier protein [Candidatus Thiodiazotropha taylori]MBT3001077.1 acyl carrier protein [Candidatus Thiodiazotropha taylori]MBV2111925.1 acyl carrier protein [Candidatus Thiodiazotropha taylori]
MSLHEIEDIVIQCLKENLELSGEAVTTITRSTKPANELSGFDSLRTLEVLISIEEKLGCELPPEKVFTGIKYDDLTVSMLAKAIDEVKKEAK